MERDGVAEVEPGRLGTRRPIGEERRELPPVEVDVVDHRDELTQVGLEPRQPRNALVEEVYDLLEARARELGIRLERNADPEMPAIQLDPEGIHRALLNVPSDVAVVCALAIRQLVAPRAVNGRFRAVPFRCSEEEAVETGRKALAEWFGSFAPNTIIVGVDPDREVILGHQLHVKGGTEAIDVLGLGEQ